MVCWIQSVSIIKKIHEMLSPIGLPIGTIFLNYISMVHVSEKHFCHCWWNSRTELSELSLAPIREHIYCPYIEGLRLLELCKIYFYAVQLFMYKWYHIKLSYIFLPLFQVNYDMTGCITCQGNLLLMPFGSIGLHQGMLVCSTVSLYNCFHNMLEYNCSWVTYKIQTKRISIVSEQTAQDSKCFNTNLVTLCVQNTLKMTSSNPYVIHQEPSCSFFQWEYLSQGANKQCLSHLSLSFMLMWLMYMFICLFKICLCTFGNKLIWLDLIIII